MFAQLNAARDLDALRFEAEKVVNGESEARSSQGLYFVSVNAGKASLGNDPVLGPLAGDLTEFFRDFDYARRSEYHEKWGVLSSRLKEAADQASLEALVLSRESVDSVEEDLKEFLTASITMLLLGIVLQVLTFAYIGKIFVNPLKKLGLHLETFSDSNLSDSLSLGSKTLEINAIESAVNRLSNVLRENRLMNQSLMENEAKLKKEMEAAKEANRIKSEFISNISHEIRTPLSTISGMLYVMERTDMKPSQKRQLQLIKQCSSHLNELITQVLDLSKIEAHMLVLDHRPFVLGRLLEECHAFFKQDADHKQLSYNFEASNHVKSLALLGDPLRLKEIIINLLSNAIKFTSVGVVSLEVDLLELGSDQQIKLQIVVTDTGIGITPEELSQLFQNFSQADSSTSRKFGGTGLGLSISKKLAELMGGDIQVESVPRLGSKFTCVVWLALDTNDDGSSLVCDLDLERPSQEPLLVSSGDSCLEADSFKVECDRLALLAAADDPTALTLFESHLAEFECALGKTFLPVKRALTHYRMEEAASLMASTGRRPIVAPGLERDTRPLILVVDDIPSNLTTLSSLLEDLCRLKVATSGIRAIELAKGAQRPDLILMDITMPDMDGFTALQALKFNPSTRSIPVVLISASSSSALREQSIQLGAVDLIDRIASPDRIREIVLNALIGAFGRAQANNS